MNIVAINDLDIILGIGAILLQVVSVVVIVLLFLGKKKNPILDFIDKHFVYLGFFVALFSVVFSLVYSEVIKFTPCMLCWWQRVFLFPQIFIFGVALWDKDRKMIRYSLPLLLVGFFISIYQNLVYYFGETGSTPCDASGVSCYQHLVSVFGGYISIPMLALTSFFFLLVISLVAHFYRKESN